MLDICSCSLKICYLINNSCIHVNSMLLVFFKKKKSLFKWYLIFKNKNNPGGKNQDLSIFLRLCFHVVDVMLQNLQYSMQIYLKTAIYLMCAVTEDT